VLRDGCLCFALKMRRMKSFCFYLDILVGENRRALYSFIHVEFRKSADILIDLS